LLHGSNHNILARMLTSNEFKDLDVVSSNLEQECSNRISRRFSETLSVSVVSKGTGAAGSSWRERRAGVGLL
jgi:hypothetical protein